MQDQMQNFATSLTHLSAPASPAGSEVLQRSVKSEPMWKVPTALTSFVGREQDVASIATLLKKPEVRLLTLIGLGGVGKTRLALQVTIQMRAYFADGVCFVALAAVSDPLLVPSTIAETLGMQEIDGQSIFEQIKLSLQGKRLLLVLDNFEQVVTAAPLIESLLTACPLLTIVVTSRAVLHLEAEHQFPVAPLTLPDLKQLSTCEGLERAAAVALFIQRVQALQPTFRLTPANMRAVAEICVRLDGLPLAIELAAARAKALTPQALLARLSRQFEILTSGVDAGPLRQSALRTTLQWSYDLLDEEEQCLFRRLSVFVGGWTLEAATAVCYSTPRQVSSVLDEVASLLDKSLLLRVEQEAVEPRLDMLMTVREYGLECLRQRGEAETILRAHSAYYLSVAETAEPALRGTQQLVWLHRLEQEQQNLRAALAWLIEQREAEQALRLCAALGWFLILRGSLSEGRSMLHTALSLPDALGRTATRARALCTAGMLALLQSDLREAGLLLSESVSIYRELGDSCGLAFPLGRLGLLLQWQGDLETARPLVEESLTLCRTLGCTWELCYILLWSGYNAWLLQGDLDQATALTHESLKLAHCLGDTYLIATALSHLGYGAWLQGDPVQARSLVQEGLTLVRALGDQSRIPPTLELLGTIALTEGDLEQATELFTEGLSVARELGNAGLIGWQLVGMAKVAAIRHQFLQAARLFSAAELFFDHSADASIRATDRYRRVERVIAAVQTQLGQQRFAAAWARARTMTLEQVLVASEPISTAATSEQSLTVPSSVVKSPRASTYPDRLTAREVEVLRLVAQGCTDAQVAEHLVISPRTVNVHLTSIYRKIQVSSRSAAKRYAMEHRLL